MNLKHLKRTLELFDNSSATELYIEEPDLKLKFSKHRKDRLTDGFAAVQSFAVPPQSIAAPAHDVQTEKTAPEAEDESAAFHVIKSPIVGAFYRSPSPESEPFVEVGTRVAPGATLCIVEAMKLMNEIECDVAGTIEKILVQNAEPVEYDQPMFYINPD